MRSLTQQGKVLLGVIVAALVGAAGITAATQVEPPFPHVKHERLFPVCEGCHVGVTTGETSELYPEPASCANCHDGTRESRVTYKPPGKRVSNLRFSHPAHDSLTARTGEEATCQSCHAAAVGPPTRMNVEGPQPATCVGCHAHRADAHLSAQAVCSQCHVPLASARELSQGRVAGFPIPPWHDRPDFISAHGNLPEAATASCSTCHARQTCERCHANAERVPLIAGLPPDARVASLEKGKHPEYPVPPSHADRNWTTTHGAVARRDITTCDNCHTRPSCTSCHLSAPGTSGQVIAALPPARRGAAPGVSVMQIARTVHPPDFATRHGVAASSGALQCTQCHAATTCSSCHAGNDSRAFHVRNFVERHAVEVFGGSGSCQSCHNTETFCRACHQQSGIASSSSMNAAFHNGQPMWILSHGQAARTGMESCASCHRQNDCVRCHSAVGGWRVNPHGPGFPANRLASRNAASCRWCHTGLGATRGGGG
jgi:predicted CXXCH cytochrome family protein